MAGTATSASDATLPLDASKGHRAALLAAHPAAADPGTSSGGRVGPPAFASAHDLSNRCEARTATLAKGSSAPDAVTSLRGGCALTARSHASRAVDRIDAWSRPRVLGPGPRASRRAAQRRWPG